MSDNFLFIISGPSGSGKTTLAKSLLTKHSDLHPSISATTRRPRQGELDGRDYYFIDEKTYCKMLDNCEFLETATIFNNHYGTIIKNVDNAIKNNRNIIFDIEYSGMQQIKEKNKFNVSTVYILPTSLAAIEERISKRHNQDDTLIKKEDIDARVSSVTKEIQNAHYYDFVFMNEDLEKSIEMLNAIYIAESIKYKKNSFISNHYFYDK
jgi:guanylate kinase